MDCWGGGAASGFCTGAGNAAVRGADAAAGFGAGAGGGVGRAAGGRGADKRGATAFFLGAALRLGAARFFALRATGFFFRAAGLRRVGALRAFAFGLRAGLFFLPAFFPACTLSNPDARQQACGA